ncbi:MAG TPA: GNAT family N-acetyltransferase [Acidimicrobiales bacterium]
MAAPSDLEIVAFDPATASDAERRAVHSIVASIELEQLPDDQPIPYEEWIEDESREMPLLRTRRRWVARLGPATVGYAASTEEHEGNTHLAWADISVVAAQRRQGIGTELLRAVVAAAHSAGRTSVGLNARDDADGAIAFLTKFGLTPRIREHHNRLLMSDLDVPMLQSWVDRASMRAGGYDLAMWDGPTPEELLEPFARVTEVMNTAPTEDLDWRDERVTPEQLREREQRRVDVGIDWWNVCAVERSTGHFAGFTQMFFTKWRKERAFQGGTAVDPPHRDKGLGRWLKAAMLLRILDEKPEVEKVDTWNAGSNEPMLGINHALGFAPIEVWVGHQADIDVVTKHLEEAR